MDKITSEQYRRANSKSRKGKHAVRNSNARKEALSKGFRSGLEQRLAERLTRAKIKFRYEPFTLNYTRKPTVPTQCVKCGSILTVEIRKYTPDFVVKNIVIEPKGMFSAKDQKKMLSVKIENPEYIYIMMFQNGKRKLSPKSKYTYDSWAIKNGFHVANEDNILLVLNSLL